MKKPDTYLHREILQIIPSQGWRAVFWGDEGEPIIVPGAYFALTHLLEFESLYIYESAVPLYEQPLISEEKTVELHLWGDYFEPADECENFHSLLAPGEDVTDELRASLINDWKADRDRKADRRK